MTGGADPHDDPADIDRLDYAAPRPSAAALVSVFRLVRPYWRGRLWLAPVILAIGVVASLAEAAGIGVIILLLSIVIRGRAGALDFDDGLVDRAIGHIVAVTGGDLRTIATLAFALLLLRVASVTLHRLIATIAEAGISDRVRRALFRSFLTMPFEETGRRSWGDMLTVLNRHSWAVAEATDGFAGMMLNGCVAGIIGLLLFLLSPLIAGMALAGTLLLNLALRLIDGPAERAGETAAVNARAVSARAMRVLQAARTIRIFGQTRAQAAAFAAESGRLRRGSIRSDLTSGMAEPLSHAAYLGIVALIAVVAVRNRLSYEQVLAAVALLYRMQPYASEFEAQRLHLATLLAPVRAIDELVALGRPIDAGGGTDAMPVRACLSFEGVRFAYPGQRQPCLHGASFDIPAGRWTLLRGESGAGKSTIVNLLLRLYDPQAGAILVDGLPLVGIDREQWLAGIAVAGQDVELIDGTILDNVRLGRPEADDAEVARVVWLSGLDALLAELTAGGETRIGERGLNLSGGQRQRLGLARALLRRPRLLILDEATSALDAEAEDAILARLIDAAGDATVILIAHRLAAGLPITHVLTLREDGSVETRADGPNALSCR
ncbi:ATP-binding cassette domain-containing protein [Sphingomonas profundi]|uniref:ATP-binding cassette domain-containing protein n=1 Tax=Alterirhizorhabdus profundi TaxID=2681549 RepID=UPI0012E72AEE|nr:ABC transporter ATP-binding protein [Sphingomonas profundi]